ncbi:hypothetical protein [Brevibacillus thermoruber]|uniref:hypothetical protein n=1 Tax=Brevibacillus thermoruber TaxID=33942 RepID=UPI0005501D4F|nr:hypothetical protein [Brevibacillus thermoruber]
MINAKRLALVSAAAAMLFSVSSSAATANTTNSNVAVNATAVKNPVSMLSQSSSDVQLVDMKISPLGIGVYAVIRTDKNDEDVWYTIYANKGDKVKFTFYKKNSKGQYEYQLEGITILSTGKDERSWACGPGDYKLVLEDETNGTSATYTFTVPKAGT